MLQGKIAPPVGVVFFGLFCFVLTALNPLTSSLFSLFRFDGLWKTKTSTSRALPLLSIILSTCLVVAIWSDYRKSLPGNFIRIRLKIEQNYRLYLDIFFSAIINDLFITFISRIKVDAKCVYQQWNWITVANYFGTPPADWVHGYLYFEPGAWIWKKKLRRYLHIVKNWSGNFSLNSSRVCTLGWPLLGIFSRFF